MKILTVLMAAALLDWRVAVAQSAEDELALSERAFVTAKIYASVQMYFAHRAGVPGFDLEAAYKRYLERAFEAKGRREFDFTTLEFIASLRNKHTQFDDQWLRERFGQSLGFSASAVEGKWVVTSADHSGLKKGDVIRSVDGTPVGEFVRDKQRFINASSERSAQSLVFDRAYLFPESFALGLDDGRTIMIQRGTVKPSVQKSAPPPSEGRWLIEPSVAYIKIPSFGDPNYERTAIEFVRKFQGAKALVIDVRSNGGGRTPYGLLRELMDREWRNWITTTPLHNALDRARGLPPAQVQLDAAVTGPNADAYHGKLILLVDRFTCSASEDFVMPFKDNGRAIIIGEATEGSSGQPYFFNFGNGMTLLVGAERHTFPDGSMFESRGISPTMTVDRHIADVQNGVDSVLDKAKEIANAQ
jgi:carboxyl-terminal processing protease